VIAFYDDDVCEEFVDDYGVEAGRWLANYEPARNGGDFADPFRLGMRKDKLVRLMVVTPGVATAGGVTVGSSRAEVEAEFPGTFEKTDRPSTDADRIPGAKECDRRRALRHRLAWGRQRSRAFSR
jgi:hypothetical protein